MQYGKKEKIQKIWLLRIEHPDMSQRAIAEEVGVAVNTVRKYLHRGGLPTTAAATDTVLIVIQLRKENPDMTLEAIGKKVGVTRERVRQILKQEGLPTVSTNGHTSSYRVPRGKCKTCGDQIGLDKKIWYSKGVRHPRYCSRECIPTKGSAICFIICYRCGKVKSRPKKEAKWRAIRNENTYCSHSCSTKDFWENISPEDKAAWVAKHKGTRKINAVLRGECEVCGADVISTYSGAKYCSKECRQLEYRRRKRLRYHNNKRKKYFAI